MLTTAPTGLNGDNETSVGGSNSVSISFQGKDKSQIEINFKEPAEFYIKKASINMIFEKYNFTHIMELIRNKSSNSVFFYNSFELPGLNISIHFQIRPNISSIGYLTLLKYGGLPTLNNHDYDHMKVFCTKGIICRIFPGN